MRGNTGCLLDGDVISDSFQVVLKGLVVVRLSSRKSMARFEFITLLKYRLLVGYAAHCLTGIIENECIVINHNKNQHMAHQFFDTLITSFGSGVYKLVTNRVALKIQFRH